MLSVGFVIRINQNSIHEEIKSRFNARNPRYHLVQNLLSSNLLANTIKIYRTIMLLVLNGCKIWPLVLREEHRLGVFESMVLRRMFGPKRKEVTGEGSRVHNEEPFFLHSSPNIIRVIKSRRLR